MMFFFLTNVYLCKVTLAFAPLGLLRRASGGQARRAALP